MTSCGFVHRPLASGHSAAAGEFTSWRSVCVCVGAPRLLLLLLRPTDARRIISTVAAVPTGVPLFSDRNNRRR